MFWVFVVAGIYFSAVALILLFVAGATRASRHWDESHDLVGRVRLDSQWDEERAA